MPNGGYKVGYASDTCVVESPYSGWLSLVPLVAGLHEILHGQKDLEDSSSRYGVAQVLRRVVFLRRVVALCFPLSAGCVFCSDMRNLFAQQKISNK